MHLSLSYSLTVIIIGVLALMASAYFSHRQWKAMNRRLPILLLEVLRFVIIILIFFTLLRPEIVTKIRQKTEPEIAILHDQSASMETVDIVKENISEPESRKTCLQKLLDSKFQAPLEKKFKVSVQGFSPVPDPSKPSEGADVIEGTDIDEALNKSMSSAKNLRAVILMTDGSWNKGASPVGAAVKLHSRQALIYSVVFGGKTYLPDIEMKNIKAPSYCLMNEKISIPFQVENHMSHDVKTKVKLSSGIGMESEKEITLPAESTYSDSIIWQPLKEGKFNLTIEVPEEKEEINKTNNSKSFEIAARKESLKVLIVESLPRWEYRYLRNAISRDPGMELSTLLFLPDIGMGGGKNYIDKFPAKNELSKYDVIFLGDVGIAEGQLSKENAENIMGLVKLQGSGLVFLPGIKGKEMSLVDSPLGDLLPVELDRSKPAGLASPVESKLVLTSTGKDHFLTMLADNPSQNSYLWRELPGFYWNTAVLSAKAGSNILAVHSGLKSGGGRMPLLVIKEYGSGNVLFMGTDSAWRWRKGVEDKYHYRFWGQVVRWMAHKRHLAHDEGIRLFYTPENPKASQTVFLNATLHDRTGMPIEDAEIIVNVKDKAGKSVQRLKMFPDKGGWGSYKGEFVPEKSGSYTLNTECEKQSISMKTDITVTRESREKTGEPANWNILKEVSQITDGELITPDEIGKLITKIMALPKYVDIEKRYLLWCQWWWGLIILVLISSYWTGRKLTGLI
ncbi:MAG TPA: hypothetical protein DET40_22780 [Lentisphaeria bacterium]|nr:MAG: hypothetical protein A2X45_16010 [Lentisphaerae bacterium GWF2_50_93]HCE46380.1 hypothetical protein [Lentisphaeria bacterium]